MTKQTPTGERWFSAKIWDSARVGAVSRGGICLRQTAWIHSHHDRAIDLGGCDGRRTVSSRASACPVLMTTGARFFGGLDDSQYRTLDGDL